MVLCSCVSLWLQAAQQGCAGSFYPGQHTEPYALRAAWNLTRALGFPFPAGLARREVVRRRRADVIPAAGRPPRATLVGGIGDCPGVVVHGPPGGAQRAQFSFDERQRRCAAITMRYVLYRRSESTPDLKSIFAENTAHSLVVRRLGAVPHSSLHVHATRATLGRL